VALAAPSPLRGADLGGRCRLGLARSAGECLQPHALGLQPYAIEATAACIQATTLTTLRVQVIGAEDDVTPLLTVRSPLSPSASWAGVTARHVRIWMISPAAALRDNPTRLGYSIHELRACARPAVQPGVPTGQCAAAAEANGLHVFHFEVCTCTYALHVHGPGHGHGHGQGHGHGHCMGTAYTLPLHMHCMCICTVLHVHCMLHVRVHCMCMCTAYTLCISTSR
jgi:hypothetical protein